jgi:hypothetical protein
MRGRPLDEIEIASLADVGWWISWGHSLNTDDVRTSEQFEAIVSSLRMSRGGLLGGDQGSRRGGHDWEGGGEGEGSDAGMAHTTSTHYIGAAAGRGRGPEGVVVAPVQRRWRWRGVRDPIC